MPKDKSDEDIPKKELIHELRELRKKVAEFELEKTAKKFDDTLRENEGKYKSLIKSMDDLVFVFDKNLEFKEYHVPENTKLYVAPDEFIGKTIDKIGFPEPIFLMMKEALEGVLKTKTATTVEYYLDLPSGRSWYDCKINVILNRQIEHDEILCVVRDITERKQVEEVLKESKERFEFAMCATTDGLYDWNLLSNDIYYSPGWKNMLGYKEDELPNDFSVWENLTDPEDVQRSWKMQQELINKQRDRFELEFKMKHKDGHWIDILSRANAYFDDNGKAIRIVGTHVDITKRKLAEKELISAKEKAEENETRFKALHNASFGGITIHDNGMILDCNLGLAEITGFTVNELIGMDGLLLIAKSSREMVMENIISGYEKPYEAFGVRKNGEEYPLRLEARIIPYKGKKVMAVEFRDITDSKKAEQLLMESNAKLDKAQQIAHIGSWSWNIELDEVSWSNELYRIAGLDPKDFLISYKIYLEMIHPDDLEFFKAATDKVLKEQKPYDREYRIVRPDKEIRFLHEKGEFFFDSNRKFTKLYGTVQDITERIKVREEKKKLQEQLQQAQKMEAIGTLAGGIAHDFNNILGIIMGYTELTLDDPANPKTIINNLQRVLSASERAKEMVQQILAFSRKNEQTMRSVNVEKVIKEVITFLRSSIPSTIEIKYNIEKSLGLIFGNATQINQILMNLCTNAAYAMKEKGGVLEIGLKETILDKDSRIIADIEPGKYQHLIVSDTGCGMSKEIMGRIFEPYFTTKEVDEGTGMGLAVIYGIIKSHKGEITVYSEPGNGTVFNVYFPVLEKEDKEDHDNQQPLIMGNNERILFVDDEITLVELGTQILEKLGYQVDSRTSSIEALEAFKLNPDKYDLVVTDMTMPNMTGVKLSREIRMIKNNIPIVLCTGFSDNINKNNFKALGINALIMKPVVKRELAEVIRVALDKL